MLIIKYRQLRNQGLQAELVRREGQIFSIVILWLPEENFGRGMKM